MVNLSGFIRYHALRSPKRVALICEDQRVSYAELNARIESLAGWLVKRGIAPGQVVAVLMKNSPAFLEIAFAVSHVGAVLLPINYRLSGEEVDYIIGNAEASLLFADQELTAQASDRCPVVEVDAQAQRGMRYLTGDAPPVPAAPRGNGDLQRLMYTSGTTDRPKGVMISYDNFYWKSAAHVIEFGLGAATRLLVALPLYHVGAFDMPGVAVLWCGGTICLHRDFDPEAVLDSIDRERITGAAMVPVMTGRLLACPQRDRYDVSSIQWIAGGGERTPESRIHAFREYFSNGRYVDAYGLTESCSGDTFMEAGREIEKIGSAGRATLHVQIEIRDESGRPLPAGEHGEICLRGPKVARGYWKDPQKTRSSFHGDWFRTGDVGYLDGDGFLFLTDRLKDMIISGGENIASSEVERVIHELPQVREVAVIGCPDPRWGEVPIAILSLVPGAALELDQLRDHCRAKLAGFKVPRQMLRVDELPRNATGKVLKRKLRELLVQQGPQNQNDTGDCDDR